MASKIIARVSELRLLSNNGIFKAYGENLRGYETFIRN